MNRQGSGGRGKLRIAAGVVLLAAVGAAFFLLRGGFDVRTLQGWVDGLGAWGPLLYMGVYLLAPVLLLPGTPLTLAAGVLFGPVWGTVYALLGATGGATLAFLVARYLASDWAERKAAGKLARLKHGIEREGWKFVAFVRLVPLVPFNFLNYALGLTRISLASYTLTSLVTMLPGAAAYVYVGYAGREAAGGGEAAARKVLLAFAALAVLAAVPWLIRRLRGTQAAEPESAPEATERP